MKERFNLSQWAIEHSFLVFAFYIAVIFASWFSVTSVLPKRMMPYVESPLIGVATNVPGLSALEVETYISKPIEERMVHIPNIRFIRSTSQEGFSMVSLEFPYGADMEKAFVDVQALMQVVKDDLPTPGANFRSSWVVPIDPLNIPIITLGLTSNHWNPVALKEFADNEVVNRLKTLPNIQSVFSFGGKKRQIQVVFKRESLEAHQLKITDIKRILDENKISTSGGYVLNQKQEHIIRLDQKIKTINDLKHLPIQSVKDQMVYLKDIAQIQDTFREQRSGYHFISKGKIVDQAIGVQVIQNPGASSPEVIAQILQVIERLKRENPGISFETTYDNAHFVHILMENIGEELLLALVLTAVAVFFFLGGNIRATLISLITIPISMAMTIILLVPIGMSLNSSTLIGLLVSIGRLVDDSIIDIHAIQKHLHLGQDVKKATIDGITEVRLSVAASTLVLVVALLPLLVCGGIVELMFVGLVWPIIFGLLCSFFVSMTLTPVLSVYFLKPESEEKSSNPIYRYGVYPFERFLERLEAGYSRLIETVLKKRLVTMAYISATLVIGFGFYYFIGGEMMPLADVGQAYGVLETQPGTSFQQTEKITKEVENLMLQHPEIEMVSTKIGVEPGGTYFTGYGMSQVNGASFMITLSDKDERTKTIWDVIDTVQKEAIEKIPGIRRLQIKEMGSDVMATAQAPISILVTGKDIHILDMLTQQVADIVRDTPGMFQVGTSWTVGLPTYEVQPDLTRLRELKLSVKDLSQQLYYSLKGGLSQEDFHQPNIRQNSILFKYKDEQRQSKQDIELAKITTSEGISVPLKSIANVVRTKTPTLIEHDSLRRSNTVLAYYRLNSPPSMDLSMEAMMKAMGQLNWPPGYSLEMRGDMTEMMDSFARLFKGLALALIFIFLILVAQFKSFLQPLQMLLSLPLEMTGVLFALFLAHQAFSSVSIMGVIVLTGMDVTAAILLIDHILHYRQKGLSRDEAIKTACPERLRPILMTALITIIVMLRIAIIQPTGLDAYAPMATVIIGGLTAGTILSLIVIPIMHTWVDDIYIWFQKLRQTT